MAPGFPSPSAQRASARAARPGPRARAGRVLAAALAAAGPILLAAWSTATAGDAGASSPDASPPDAGGEGGADATSDLAALRERAVILRRHRDAVRTLLAGSLPEDLYTTELFVVSLLDEEAVEARRRALEKQIASRTAKTRKKSSARPAAPGSGHRAGGAADAGDAGPPDGDAGPPEAGGDLDAVAREIDALELELDEGRLAFLRRPLDERRAVLAAEEQHRRLAEEQAAAVAAKIRAESQEQAAEEARQRALAEANAAREAGERALANERARAEGVRAQQAALQGDLAERRRALMTEERDGARRLFELTQQVQDAAPASAAADALYDQIAAELTRARAALRAALDDHAARAAAPRYAPGSVPAEGRPELGEQVRAIGAAADAIDAERAKLAWDAADVAADRVAALNAQRLALLGKTSADKHAAVLGAGVEGRAQLRREIDHLALMGRWAWLGRSRTIADAAAALSRPLVLGGLLARLAAVVALALAARFAARHGEPRLGAARAFAARTLRRRIVSLPIQALLGALRALLPEAALLGVVLGAGAALGASDHGVALAAAYRVVVAFAAYRLAIAAAHRAIARLASTPLASLAAGRSDKILASLRLAGRYGLAVSVFLVISEAVLGRGYLHHVTTRFAWLGAIPIAAILVRAWRDDICDAYLASHGQGSLADAVRRTRAHWYGFFVAVAAFLAVLVGFLARSARRFVLGFEQSRKALAYLFRRRLEKRSADQSPASVSTALPAEVLAELSTEPVSGEAHALDRYPRIDAFERAVAGWRDAGEAGAMLVVGKTGYGKTSWLNEAAARVGATPVTRLDLDARVDGAAAFADLLARAIDAPGGGDLASLAAALREGPRRVVIIDDAQNLFQRGVGTLEPWRALCDVVSSTGDRVFWLVAVAHHPYEYLAWTQRGDGGFRDVVQIPAWTEREMAELLLARTRATGWEPVYEDLVVDRLEGVEAESQLVSTAQDYLRLIWDYAEGSPRVALHCWAGSLAADGDRRLRVRLFRRPEEELLDRLGDAQKFVLAAVNWHESLTADEAVRALRYPRTACADALRMLRDRGVLWERAGRFRVAVAWWPAVRRYLRRKHLIET